MDPAQIRLEALRLALTNDDDLNTITVIARAAAYADFLNGINFEKSSHA